MAAATCANISSNAGRAAPSWSDVIINSQRKIDTHVAAKKAEQRAIEEKNKIAAEKVVQAKLELTLRAESKAIELRKFIDNMLEKTGGKPVVADGHPNFGAIIRTDESEEFDYLYVGCYHDPLTLNISMSGDRKEVMILSDACPMFVVEYDPNSINYMIVRAVFKHSGKYYFIPESFSLMGTMDPRKKWTFVEQAKPRSIPTLSYDACKKICPGFLD
jgi:hypothetical protein